MQSYKTFLNAVRAAISKAVNRMSAQLSRVEKQCNELAYVPIYETPVEDVWSGVLTSTLTVIESGFPELVVGKEYTVAIGDVEYRAVATIFRSDGQSVVYISDGLIFEYQVFLVASADGVGVIITNDEFKGQTMTIQLIGDPVEVGKEWLRDYVDEAKTAASKAQSAAKTAQSTAETAQSTAKTAQSTAETAQSTAKAAQSTAETAQSTAETAYSERVFWSSSKNGTNSYGNTNYPLSTLPGFTNGVKGESIGIFSLHSIEDKIESFSYYGYKFRIDMDGKIGTQFKPANGTSEVVLIWFSWDADPSGNNVAQVVRLVADAYLNQLRDEMKSGDTEFALKSPSGKLFKITVSDDGTLTTEESTTTT